ncbi:MAG: beta-ketoacyl-ACP synthase II [Anaerolineales bacterium]|nr:beta-ketoacyl-ACP synthase II [Anaerolineales bacterium]
MNRLQRHRVVVTGLGAITPLALNVKETWAGLLAGRSGVALITQFDASDLPCRIAAEVKGFNPRDYVHFKEARRMSRVSLLAVAAAQEAVADAGLSVPVPEPERTGVLIGTGMGGFERSDKAMQGYRARGLRAIGPFDLISSVPNMPAFHVSRELQAKGPLSTVVAACATGTQSIGEGAEWIRRGSADVVVAGGAEGLVHIGTIAGFIAMHGLSLRNDEPEKASRPFDADRDGFVSGEGAGVVVLERLEHALARGAHIYAEVLGQASSADAFHPAAPDPNGAGAVRAMRWALEDAGVSAEEVDYINPHGSSTPLNDKTETMAIKNLFGEHAYRVAISASKSMLGHLMGAAGAVEAIASILTLEHGIIHPTINYDTPDPECDLDYVPNVARKAEVNVVLSNSFGLGGQNACLVLARFDANV